MTIRVHWISFEIAMKRDCHNRLVKMKAGWETSHFQLNWNVLKRIETIEQINDFSGRS